MCIGGTMGNVEGSHSDCDNKCSNENNSTQNNNCF
jgi:hypothetical protein